MSFIIGVFVGMIIYDTCFANSVGINYLFSLITKTIGGGKDKKTDNS